MGHRIVVGPGRRLVWGAGPRRLAASVVVAMVATPLMILATGVPAAAVPDAALGPWQWRNPLPQGSVLRDVHFVNDQVGTAVGETGTIMRTSDGGQSWTQQPNPLTGHAAVNGQGQTGDGLNAVQFLSPTTGVTVAGPGGHVLRTVDGGDTWTLQDIDEMTEMFGLSLATDQVGYIAGARTGNAGAVLRTGDGGQTWAPKHPPEFFTGAEGLNGVSAPSPDVVTVVGAEALIARSEDGGDSWVLQHHDPDMGPLEGVQFLGDDLGWAVGQGGRIFHTSNGGDTWDQQFSTTTQLLHSVRFTSPEVGWAVGNGGVVVHTSDGGDNWRQQPTGTGQSLRGVWFLDDAAGWVVGAGGMMMHTSDGGVSWSEYGSAVTRQFLSGVSFPTANVGTAVGGGGTILRTENGGDSWQVQDSGTIAGLSSVSFPSEAVGAAVGNSGTIVRTEDGGDGWQVQDSGTSQHLRDVHFIDADRGWAAGRSDTVLRTTDGGDTWTPIPTGDPFITRNGVYFVDADTGWVVGNKATEPETIIWHTTDGGDTWQPQPSGTAQHLNDVYFADHNRGWAVGNAGVALRTTDGGAIWQQTPLPAVPHLVDLYGVSFAGDGTTGTIVGLTGILRTEDAGLTWQAEPRPTNTHLSAVDHVDADTAVTVGGDGTILYRDGDDDGGGPGEPPSEASQDIVAVVPQDPGQGSLIVSVDPDDRTVELPPMQLAGSGDRLATSGALRPVTVTDTRTADPGWDASAQVSDFSSGSGSFGGGFLGWTPQVDAQSGGQQVTPGAPVAPGFPTGDGLSVPQTLATTPAGDGTGVAELGAGLALEVPVDTPAGTYTAVLTLTAI